MHPNPIFHTQTVDRNIIFARERAFGALAVNGADGPLLAHVPVLVDETGSFVDIHLVRSNPIARALKAPAQAKIAISGPDSYISPDWYDVPDQVPTWNYVAGHLTGTLERLPQEQMP
ncbi:FMN-binding negative transcriptional regulator [Tateyamaria sp.]|uniref:FMN-binding negative transcriptional regulator n=1 Tax=Tateyamaria sp. TaxID=1929288 RepID=UPI003B21D12F